MPRFAARREPFSRGEKLLFAILPLALAGFVWSARWIARAEELPDIVFPAPAAVSDVGGLDFYLAAAGAIRPANPAVDPIDDRRALLYTNPKLAAQNYSLARRRAWLSANRSGFVLFKQGLLLARAAQTKGNNKGNGKGDARRNPKGILQPKPLSGPGWGQANGRFINHASLRQLARSKAIEANTLILRGRWSEATQSCLDTIEMGYDIARCDPAGSRLMGSVAVAIGRGPLFTQKLAPEHLSAPQARAAARRLEAILLSRPSFREFVVQSKWQSLKDFLAVAQRSNWRALANQSTPEMAWRDRMSLQFLSPREVAHRISDEYDQKLRDLETPYRGAAPDPAPSLDPISSQFFPSDMKFQQGREFVTLDTLLLRLSLRAYRLENGRFPAALNQLAPRYLRRIPMDYFAANAPFHYRRTRKSYDLWSVGPDGRDNGGTPITDYDNLAPPPPPPLSTPPDLSGRLPSMRRESSGDYVAGKNG